MSFTSTYMGLTVWNLLSDLFDHTQLEGDLVALDAHDHTTGKGKQIPTGGIADGAVTTSKIASGAITSGLLGTGVVEGVNIDPTTNVTIAGLTVTGNEAVDGTLTVNNVTVTGNETVDGTLNASGNANLLKMVSAANFAIKWGHTSILVTNGNASGSVLVTHSLGRTPSIVMATFAADNSTNTIFELLLFPALLVNVSNGGNYVAPTSSTFWVTLSFGGGNPVNANAHFGVDWAVIG